MKLSKTDRMLLVNQFEILKKLDPASARSSARIIEAVTRGYSWVYEHQFEQWIDDEMPEEESEFVLAVLAIYSLAEHHKGDAQVSKHLRGRFAGFDGNKESRYMAFSRFLVERDERFGEVKSNAMFADFNSHAPTLWFYEPMVAKWRALGSPSAGSLSNLMEVLDAGLPR